MYELFIDNQERKSQGIFDSKADELAAYLDPHKTLTKQYVRKQATLPVADFWIVSADRLDMLELKIDGDVISSLNSDHIRAQLDKMVKFKTTKAKALSCGVALTDDFFAQHSSKEIFTLTKRLYRLKNEFPTVSFFFCDDAFRKERTVSAIVVCLERWFGWVGKQLAAKIAPPEHDASKPPIMERDFTKGPIFALTSLRNGITPEKAVWVYEQYPTLYDVVQLSQNQLEACWHGKTPTAVADSMNLYESFHANAIQEQAANEEKTNPDMK